MKNLAARVVNIPALPVQVMLRRRIGYRHLTPFNILLSGAVVVWFGGLVSAASIIGFGGRGGPSRWPVGLFLAAFVGLALLQRRSAYRNLFEQQDQHPDGRGISHLVGLTAIPGLHKLAQENRFQRWAEPLLVFALGLVLLPLFGRLGGLLMFTGACLGLAEGYEWERQVDWLCNRIAARIDGETVAAQEGASPAELMQRLESMNPAQRQEVSSTPAGLSAELQARIEANRQRLGEKAATSGGLPFSPAAAVQSATPGAAAPGVATPGQERTNGDGRPSSYAPPPAFQASPVQAPPMHAMPMQAAPEPAPTLPAGLPRRPRPGAAGPDVPPAGDGNQPRPTAQPGHEFEDVLGPPPPGFKPFGSQ